MVKVKFTHEDHLKRICCVCARKTGKEKSFRNVTVTKAEQIRKFIQPNYNRDGGLHPTVICPTCSKACASSAAAEKGESKAGRFPPIKFDYDNLILPDLLAKKSKDCNCSFCCIGRLQMKDHVDHNKKRTNPRGPAKNTEKEEYGPDATFNPNI